MVLSQNTFPTVEFCTKNNRELLNFDRVKPEFFPIKLTDIRISDIKIVAAKNGHFDHKK